jgi:hypothetical protein
LPAPAIAECVARPQRCRGGDRSRPAHLPCCAGDYRLTPEFLERFHAFSISSPFDMCRAYRENEVIERTSQDAFSDSTVKEEGRHLMRA